MRGEVYPRQSSRMVRRMKSPSLTAPAPSSLGGERPVWGVPSALMMRVRIGRLGLQPPFIILPLLLLLLMVWLLYVRVAVALVWLYLSCVVIVLMHLRVATSYWRAPYSVGER